MGAGKTFGVLSLALASGLLMAAPAAAAAKISVEKEFYRISGKTGGALLDQMDRRGPKHGFMSRAIAQTRYSMNSSADWRYSEGICRARNVEVELRITYVYPQPQGRVSGDLKRRWGKFMKGVVAHEEMHGKLAREMARAVDKAISGMAVRDRRNCAGVQRQMKRKVNAIVAEYEARQERFDTVEHREGGTIERLVRALMLK